MLLKTSVKNEDASKGILTKDSGYFRFSAKAVALCGESADTVYN